MIGDDHRVLAFSACAEPALDVPVELPIVENAVRVPATTFIGPLDPSRASDVELCADPPDHVALLRSGAFGWRVIVLRGDDVWLPVPGTPHVRRELDLRRHFDRWAAASHAFTERCGRADSSEFLMAADPGTAMVAADDYWWGTRFLVADPTPGSPPPEAASGREPTRYDTPYLFRDPEGWIASTGTHDPVSHHDDARDAADAIDRVGKVIVYVSPEDDWREGFAAADALVTRGRRPVLGRISWDGRQPAETPRTKALVHLGPGDWIDVFEFSRGGRGATMLFIGTTGEDR